MKIKGAYDCSYCHGDIDNACTACDPECDCLELYNHREGECDFGCQFCEQEAKRAASSMGKRSAQSRLGKMTKEERSAAMRELQKKRSYKKKTD